MRTPHFLTLPLATVALALSACGVDQASNFKEGFPRQSTVAMTPPGSASTAQPLTASPGRQHLGLLGETAMFYRFTHDVTDLVNGGGAAVLTLLEHVVENPPTTATADSAVWGPFTDALSANTWRLTVTRVAGEQYRYALDGRGKTQTDADFRTVLSGTHLSTGHALGTGQFVLDWNVEATLPQHGDNAGRAQYTYSRTAADVPTTVDASFTQVRDSDSGQLVDATYLYASTPGQGGTLDFQMIKDVLGGPALEQFTVRSRWQQTGAGRADVHLTQGDVGPTPASLSECWDANFASQFVTATFDPTQAWGTEAACVFAAAEYARI
jgi:hypothetical protein